MALETPYDIRDEAMNDLLKGYSSNFAANNKKFKMKLCSKKDPQQYLLNTGARLVVNIHCFLKSSQQNLFEYDSCLVMNRLGEYYLCIPRPLEIRAENQGPISQKVLI